ncbi:Cytochrome c heme lyase subunit CcmH [hydrothermal vent metagenome]|uniref:Cytochrome c heme lyase subunit CcmH n=1 Tax=hydrothermal vent metagenome TaxID=652676 RepID=A0A3B0ZH34_9ZZZZ
MMIFWLVAVLLMVAMLLFLLPPLIKARAGEGDVLARDELNLTIFKDQMNELKADQAVGVLTSQQYDVARQDLERDFLHDSGGESSEVVGQTDRIIGRAAAAVIVVLLPVMAVSIYGLLGAGAAGLDPDSARPDMQAEGHQGSLDEQIVQLRAHLQNNPEDAEGWLMLARSYHFMKDYTNANGAYERAAALIQNPDPNFLADWADTAAMAQGRQMAGRPYELAQKALGLDPSHQKALWLAGTAAFETKDYAATLEYWQRLVKQFPEGSENHVQMQRNIDEIKGMLGASVEVPQTAAVQTPASDVALHGVVRLSDELKGRVSPEQTVFVYARAPSGPRMPLAIVRKQVKDLPLTFTLDDSTAMTPAMKLSAFPQVMVGARVSMDGNAVLQSGDMETVMGPIDVSSAGELELVIDTIVP